MKHNMSLKKYTIIIGCGRLGASLANELSDENEDVLVIDRDKLSFRKLSPAYGGLTLIGDATDYKVLEEAQISKATTVVVVTNKDNTNVMIAQMIKCYHTVDHVVIRLYDPERVDVYNEQGISTISPLLLSKAEVSKRINQK